MARPPAPVTHRSDRGRLCADRPRRLLAPYGTILSVARVQVLVQLDDELLSLLDERAAAAGVSRSEMVRRGVRAVLATDVESKLDEAIAEGYKRIPPAVPDASVERLAVASIEQEPW